MEINGIEIRAKSADLFVEEKGNGEYLSDGSLFWGYDVFGNLVSGHKRVEYKIFKWTGLVYNENFFTCDNIFHKNNGKIEENLYFFIYKGEKIFYFYDYEKIKFQKFLWSGDLKDLEGEINFIGLKFSEKKDLIEDYKQFI